MCAMGVGGVGGVWVCRGSCLRRNDERGRRNDGCRWVSGVGGLEGEHGLGFWDGVG